MKSDCPVLLRVALLKRGNSHICVWAEMAKIEMDSIFGLEKKAVFSPRI